VESLVHFADLKIPGVPACLEHTGVVTQLIREERECRGDLFVLWLDLTPATVQPVYCVPVYTLQQ